jgi:hypothetical protein
MILLIFAAGLIREFRFVSTVTILQQGIHQPWWEAARHRPPAEATEQQGQGNHKGTTGRPPAEDLGKRWRFFPTYAEVQTSPVLRQQFLRTA